MKLLNEEAFEYQCKNGTVFKADRTDFIGGVNAFVPTHLSRAEMMEDAAEMGAWHSVHSAPKLTDFTSPGKFTIYPLIVRRPGHRDSILEMPLMEFFTLESLREFEIHANTAMRAHRALEKERDWRIENSALPINTVREFLENCSRAQLFKRTPGFSKGTVELILRRLGSEQLHMKEA